MRQAGYVTSGTWELALRCDYCRRTRYLRLPLAAHLLAEEAAAWAMAHTHEEDGDALPARGSAG